MYFLEDCEARVHDVSFGVETLPSLSYTFQRSLDILRLITSSSDILAVSFRSQGSPVFSRPKSSPSYQIGNHLAAGVSVLISPTLPLHCPAPSAQMSRAGRAAVGKFTKGADPFWVAQLACGRSATVSA